MDRMVKTGEAVMIYTGRQTKEISFPLGGIGAGCIGLSGNGHLIDWEIFNQSGKGISNGWSHFAVRAEKNGKVLDFRLLHGDEYPPYSGSYAPGTEHSFRGFGWGPFDTLMCGWPHFRKHTFRGEFPFAEIDFEEPEFPGKINLHAWSPFIPGNSRDSSFPAACFRIELENNTDEELDYTCIGLLANPWTNPEHRNKIQENKLMLTSGLPEENLKAGDLTLTLLPCSANISGQEYLYRGGWVDDREVYWSDIQKGGTFKNRFYETARPDFKDHGFLAAHVSLAPGERKSVRFCITWNIPRRKNTWTKNIEELARAEGIKNVWRNYYATQWKNSSDSADELTRNIERIEQETAAFHDALFFGNIPEPIKEGVSANLATLKTATCLRLEDGTFYGWEGVGSFWGSCPGSCTHVWNYAQTLPFLFPDLERSMRESHLKYSVDSCGGSHFRLQLPLGIHAKETDFRPCADGQFGDVMKFFRDWKICGNDEWLKHWWPTLRKNIEYAWSEKNPDRWDPDKTGILHGRQHHTLDMELFGPNAWLSGHYLGALSAASQMAEAVGDLEFSTLCRDLFLKGREFLDENLFNGEYYTQKINLKNPALLETFGDAKDFYWNSESGEIKYQIGDGCAIDTPLGQYYASLYGIGDVFDPERNLSSLKSIYRNNYKKSVRDVFNPWRIYSVNDESGVQICSWPEGHTRPVIPIPYNTETMHGFEWSFAAHLAMVGMLEESEEIVRSIRFRYDGEKRNPWNEIECGSNYARSMAAYGLIPALSGFRYDAVRGMIGFFPKKTDFRSFWSLGSVWGTVSCSASVSELSFLYGGCLLREIGFPKNAAAVLKNGSAVPYSVKDGVHRFPSPLKIEKGDVLRFEF